jgi:hypothetical protein
MLELVGSSWADQLVLSSVTWFLAAGIPTGWLTPQIMTPILSNPIMQTVIICLNTRLGHSWQAALQPVTESSCVTHVFDTPRTKLT